MILPLGLCSIDADAKVFVASSKPSKAADEAVADVSRRSTLRDDWGGASQSVTVGGIDCGCCACNAW